MKDSKSKDDFIAWYAWRYMHKSVLCFTSGCAEQLSVAG